MRAAWVRVGIFLLLGHLLFSLGYYAVPWRYREPLYRVIPSFNRFYMGQAFAVWRWWDRLGWTGDDVSARAVGEEGDAVCVGGEPMGELITQVLTNQAYRVGYSDAWRSPLWVAYRLDRVEAFVWGKRPSSFRVERRVEERLSAAAFSGSGYDRGHMAPNFGIATRYGREAQLETFVMSNIVGQRPWLNRGIWRRLEVDVARSYAQRQESIWVMTGPVFGEGAEPLDSGAWVPEACYKICVDAREDGWRVMAFLMEQTIPPYTRLRSRLVSVDEIERMTGLDFFPRWPEELERLMEAEAASRLWPMQGPLVWFDE